MVRFGAISLVAAAFAGAWVVSAMRVRADASAERLVVYVNEDNERVRAAVAKLDAALHATSAARRHRVRLQHVVANLWDAADVEAKLRQALAMRPAAIIAVNGESAMIAKSLTREVPIIFGSHQDPIKLGLAESLARPGGNVTGFTFHAPIDLKRLEFLRQVSPGARKLGVLIDRWWMDDSGGKIVLQQARERQGFEPELFVVENLADLRKVLSTPKARSMDAWFIPNSVLPFDRPAGVSEEFADVRKPVMFPATPFVERGGLVSYQQILSLEDALEMWATMVGLVLDGVAPADIPIERPKAFELAVNLRAAQRLGISVPVELMKRADRVIDGVATRK